MVMTISSPAFQNESVIPKKHTGDGPDLSPKLEWSGVPEGAKSLALIADDPDAPMGTWVHWVVYDIPPDAKGLDEGVSKAPTLPNGAKQGTTDFRRLGYGGPAPPKGKPHRYFFKLYALDQKLNLQPGATKADVEKAMKGHVLGEAQLMGKYQR